MERRGQALRGTRRRCETISRSGAKSSFFDNLMSARLNFHSLALSCSFKLPDCKLTIRATKGKNNDERLWYWSAACRFKYGKP